MTIPYGFKTDSYDLTPDQVRAVKWALEVALRDPSWQFSPGTKVVMMEVQKKLQWID